MGTNTTKNNSSKTNQEKPVTGGTKTDITSDNPSPDFQGQFNLPGGSSVGGSYNPETNTTSGNVNVKTPVVDVKGSGSHQVDPNTGDTKTQGSIEATKDVGIGNPNTAGASAEGSVHLTGSSETVNHPDGSTTTTNTVSTGVKGEVGVTVLNQSVTASGSVFEAEVTTRTHRDSENNVTDIEITDLDVSSDVGEAIGDTIDSMTEIPLDEEAQAVLDGLTGDDEQFVETLGDGLGVGDNLAGEGNSLMEGVIPSEILSDEGSIFSQWDSGDTQAAVNLGMSIFGLYNAIDGGDGLAIASAGINTLVSVNGLLDSLDGVAGDGLGGFMDADLGNTLGGITAAIGLFSALDNGDALGAVSSGLQVLSSLGVMDTIPGLGAAVSVFDGDPMGAMTSMVAMIPGWGWAAAAVLSIFGGSLMGDPPDPRAFMDFVRNADGEIDFTTSSNETGGGLEAMLDGSGSAFVQYLEALEDGYARVLPTGQIEVDALPRLDLHQEYGHDEVEWRMVGGRNMEGATNIIGVDPDGADVFRAIRDTFLISHENPNWAIGTSSFVDPATGETITQTHYSPFGLMPPSVSKAVPVGPILQAAQVGGYAGVVSAKDNEIRTIDPKPIPSAAKELKDVQQSWRINKSIFEGEQGSLLAMGLAAGLVGIEDIAAAAVPEYEQLSLVEQEEYLSLIEQVGSAVVAGFGVIGEVDSFDAREAIQPAEDHDTDISEFYSRRDDLFADSQFSGRDASADASQRADERSPDTPTETASSPVFINDDDNVFDIRDVANPDFGYREHRLAA